MSFVSRLSIHWGWQSSSAVSRSLIRRPAFLHGVNYLSTTSSTSSSSQAQNHQDAALPKQRKLARTLYRQLLRWCYTTDSRTPLSFFIPPPLTIQPPQVDRSQLKALYQYHQEWKQQQNDRRGSQQSTLQNSSKDVQRVHDILPPKCQIEQSRMLVTINNATDLKNLIRAVYRLNNKHVRSQNHQQELVSLAFQGLRSLNELSAALDELNENRQSNAQRSDQVLFKVGQVVQHKLERWRGVVTGWEEPSSSDSGDPNDDPKPLTSLTTKTYSGTEYMTSIRYEVLLDAGDMLLMQATSPVIYSIQSDLELVQDERLSRIRSNLCAEHFKRFDSNANSFVPSDMLAYEFPADIVSGDTQQSNACEGVDAANSVIAAIKAFARHLEQCIPSTLPDAKGGEFQLLLSFQERIASLASARLVQSPTEPGVDRGHDDESPLSLAAMYLRLLLNIILEVRDILSHRQISKPANLNLKLGDIVYHKLFGFRGVVVAYDLKPTLDVSHWDGVRHIDKPLEKPFYHVIPDQNDCVLVFGSERGMRYVCQDNLELCHTDRQTLNVDLDHDSDWVRTLAQDGTTVFDPPIEVKFKHGEDIGDENITETILHRIQDEITFWQVACRDANGTVAEEAMVSGAPPTLKLSTVFDLLKAADKVDDAMAVEETLKEMWKAHKSPELRLQLENGITDVLRGKAEDALANFKALTEEDSTYAEAWNKISACEYMLGNMPSSLAAAEKALELLPLHFQALNGVGLISFEQGNYDLAAASFQRSIDIDPWSPVSSKLAVCLDLLEHNKSKDTKNGPDDDS